jgi:hypothetical protein
MSSADLTMAFQFKKHYTVEEARALMPDIRKWVAELTHLRDRVTKADQRFSQLHASGCDLGGRSVDEWIRDLCRMREVLLWFESREIQLKDLERGLIDFPALMGGKEVFLCWEQDEEDIEFWHDLETGFAGRERLPEA